MNTCESHGSSNVIEVRVPSLAYFYNVIDPSPGDKKELNRATDSFIMDSLREMSAEKRKSAIVLLDLDSSLYTNESTRTDIERTINSHFSYRYCSEFKNYKYAMSRGRRYLARGLIFLIICLVLSSIISSFSIQNDIINAIGQSFVVIGWVSLWKPVEFYLYDRRDILDELNMLRLLETIQVTSHIWTKPF